MPEVIGWIHFDEEPEWIQSELITDRFLAYAELEYEPGSQAMIAHEASGSTPRVDLMSLLLPLVLEKEKRGALIREKERKMIWFNRIYTDQKGPTGPVGPATDIARFLIA